MIEAQEERKQQRLAPGLSVDTGSVATPLLPAASPSPTLNPARPKGLLDIDYTTFKPRAQSSGTSYGGELNTGQNNNLTAMATPQLPSNTLFGSSAYAPYQPYTPPSYGRPLSPAPTPPMPLPAAGFAPTLTPGLAIPAGIAPAPTGFTPTVFGTTVPSLLSGTPFSTAPATSPLFTSPATGLPTPATAGTPMGTPLKGLLDQSYVKSPAGDAPSSLQGAGAAAQYPGSGSSSAYRLYNPGIIGDPEKTLDDILNPKSTSEIVTEVALRLAHEEIIQVFKDFWAYYNTASQHEKSQIHSELRDFGLSMVPGVGEVIDLKATLESEKASIAKGLTAIAIILSALIPALGKGRKILKFWRWFKSVAKRTAKKAVKVWTKDAVKSMVRDAALGLAEELAAQIVANGYSYKNWDAYDLGISAASGAVTGAIGQMPNETLAAWSDIANSMFTALAKETLSSGNTLEDLVTATERAGWKTILMGVSTRFLLFLLKDSRVLDQYHGPIMVTLNVVMDKLWDKALDMWYSSR